MVGPKLIGERFDIVDVCPVGSRNDKTVAKHRADAPCIGTGVGRRRVDDGHIEVSQTEVHQHLKTISRQEFARTRHRMTREYHRKIWRDLEIDAVAERVLRGQASGEAPRRRSGPNEIRNTPTMQIAIDQNRLDPDLRQRHRQVGGDERAPHPRVRRANRERAAAALDVLGHDVRANRANGFRLRPRQGSDNVNSIGENAHPVPGGVTI